MYQTVRPVRLIALDLDGTLLYPDHSISERTQNAIDEARQRGVRVTVATGRMYASSIPFVRQIKVDMPFVTSQGAMVRTVDGGVVSHQPIAPRIAWDVVDYALTHGHHVNVYINDMVYVQKDGKTIQEYAEYFTVPYEICDLRELLKTAAPTKILFLENEETMPALQAALNRRFENRLHMVLSHPAFLEVNHPDTNKWNAIRDIGRLYGIEGDEIMAIGDSLNDLEMVRDAGWGVAMGNAMDEVKQAARLMTDANDRDGAAKAIERWVLRSYHP
jgi:Cof subfamily protein (haloacid dehalogenase superfamily)